MRFLINTRPTARADALNRALVLQGIQVLNLPLLELNALPFNAQLAALYAELTQAQTLVVVSPTAVALGMQYLQQAGIALSALQHLHWVAVGQSTAQALAYYHIEAEVPEVENSEGMLQLNALNDQALHCVAVWRGLGGRQFMLEQLQQRGVRLLNFLLYQRQCPTQAATQLKSIWRQLPQNAEVYVLISSEASWHNWLRIQTDSTRVYMLCYLVLGQRLAKLIQCYAAQQHRTIQMTVLNTLQAPEIYSQMVGGAST